MAKTREETLAEVLAEYPFPHSEQIDKNDGQGAVLYEMSQERYNEWTQDIADRRMISQAAQDKIAESRLLIQQFIAGMADMRLIESTVTAKINANPKQNITQDELRFAIQKFARAWIWLGEQLANGNIVTAYGPGDGE